MKKIKIGLIPRLIVAIIIGIILGNLSNSFVVKILVTFSSIFGNFLGFVIPLIILGFVISGISDLGEGAGKLLGLTTLIAYMSTLISGFTTYLVGSNLFPKFINTTKYLNNTMNPENKLLKPFFTIEMPPVMGVMTALILAFILGLGISSTKSQTLYNAAIDFQKIIQNVINKIIIPLLPIHIAGIFSNMTYAGEVKRVLSVFGKIFLIVLCLHLFIILFQFVIASIISKKSLALLFKNQVPAYLTALGTQSSAATIPVNLDAAKKNGVSKNIREFVIPLCATIHLSGSTITLTSCALAVMLLNNISYTFPQIMGFIAMLGVTMVAAPGIPGGAVMAALGVLQTILGFSKAELGLMIALYITQDSFGTACNISGDSAIALIIDKIYNKTKNNNIK